MRRSDHGVNNKALCCGESMIGSLRRRRAENKTIASHFDSQKGHSRHCPAVHLLISRVRNQNARRELESAMLDSSLSDRHGAATP